MHELFITDIPVTGKTFRGIGAEADCFIFDDTNKACGVNDADLELIERRMRAVRPAIARLFVDVRWVNPSLDGETLVWDGAYYGHLLRQLRLLDDIGTKVNLVLFLPHPPMITDASPLVRAMIGLFERLRDVEGLKCLAWLTLYNEPDSIYPHDSPLSRRLFGEQLKTQPPFADYVRINNEAYNLLIERGLYPEVKLIVADTVWGHPMRVERMRLCAEAFKDLDVVYSYHNYSPEDPELGSANPDFAYPGMLEEQRLFREALGDRELMLWEFNNPGPGFTSHFPGVGHHGTEILGLVETGAEISDRVMRLAALGVNGFSLWCLHDVVYLNHLHELGPMPFGLWRFKWQNWIPRPYYHYYALLCQSFRPGSNIVRVDGETPFITALAAVQDDKLTLGLLNTSQDVITFTVHGLPERLTGFTVHPAMIPNIVDLPASEEASISSINGTASVALQPGELCIVVAE